MDITTFPRVNSWQPTHGCLALNGAVSSDQIETGPLARQLGRDLKTVLGHGPIEDQPGTTRLQLDPTLPPSAYTITIDDDVTIRAAAFEGHLHGSQVLLQLLRGCPSRRSVPRGSLSDAPTMPIRGQMIDVGRKFLSVDILRREIRRMAWYRLNSLHLHLTEWNGFRIGSERFPGLASHEHYTLDELRDLDAYAKAWGVTIIPELDLPGHAVWLTAYEPRLRFLDSPLDFDPHPGGMAGGWTLNVTSDFARTFVKELLTEITEVFSGPYVHIGGDEVPTHQVDRCPQLAEYARQHGLPGPADVMVDFTNDLAAHLRTLGRRAELWEWWDVEAPRPLSAPDKDIRISKWLGDAPPTRWANEGYDVVGVNWDSNFCTPGYGTSPHYEGRPGFEGFMPAEDNYERNNYPHGTSAGGGSVLGYRMGRWMDKAEARPYEWVDFYAQRGLQTIAERTWGTNGSDSAVSAFERADSVGKAPGDGPELVTLPRAAVQSAQCNSEETVLHSGSATHIIDHDRRTTWVSRFHHTLALPPHMIEIQLHDRQNVGGVTIWPRQDGGSVHQFHDSRGLPRHIRVEVEASQRWEVAWEGQLPEDMTAHPVTFAPQLTQRIRLVILSDWDNLMIVALAGISVQTAALQS